MEDVTRKRVLRKLDALPEDQLYQVLDYIEFLESKYARAAAREPDAFQRFAERVEDQMRVRALAPRAMRGTMKLMSTAGRVLDGVRDLGREVVGGATGTGPANGRVGALGGAPERPDPGPPSGEREDGSPGSGSAASP